MSENMGIGILCHLFITKLVTISVSLLVVDNQTGNYFDITVGCFATMSMRMVLLK